MNPEPRKSGTYELPRGSVVGKYEIMRRLAVGGMAEIYLARVTGAAGFEKLVVLKRILPNVGEDPTFVSMFLDEAKLAATLRHPNIADVYDVGEDGGSYFFTMEYVYGDDVRAIRHEAKKRNERIPLNVALAIVHGVASALDHVHERPGPDGKLLNLVHRDVSASNVMVSYDGAVKLLDFGIARANSSTHKTQTGTLKGKIPYMSPEQCKGLALDRRSDLFSLGVVLYELTVGRRPFRGESDFAIMDQIVYQGATAPSQVVSNYPAELEAIVMKLLERGPSMRYPTGEDLLHDLDDFISKHGLWLSPRAIGKYMRTLFAEKMQAWEQAEQEGIPFATHVATTITSESQRSELLTPPSQFSSVEPRTTSQQMAAVQAPLGRRISSPMPAMEPLPQVTPSPLPHAIAMDSAPFGKVESAPFAKVESAPFGKPDPDGTVYPSLRPRSTRTIMLAFISALVLGAGGLLGFVMSKRDKAVPFDKQEPTKMESEATQPDVKPAEVKPAEAKAAVKPMKSEPVKAEPSKPVDVKAEPAKPVDVKAQPAKPVEVKAETEAAKKAEAAKLEAKKVEAAKLEVKKAEAAKLEAKKVEAAKLEAAKLEAKKVEAKKAEAARLEAKRLEAKRAEAARLEAKKLETKKVKKTEPKPEPEPKEKTWDPNSPFLPQ